MHHIAAAVHASLLEHCEEVGFRAARHRQERAPQGADVQEISRAIVAASMDILNLVYIREPKVCTRLISIYLVVFFD